MPSHFRFGDHFIDVRGRSLRCGDAEVSIEPKVFDSIVYLIEQRGRAVGRDELIAAVWGKVDVSDAMLGQAILKARRAIGDDGRAQGAIRTVSRFGYQWVMPVEDLGSGVPAEQTRSDVPQIPQTIEPAATVAAPPEAATRRDPPLRRSRRNLALATLALALAATAAALIVARPWRASPPQVTASTPSAAPRHERLVLVLPMRVRSPLADDTWLRFGLLALVEESLSDASDVGLISADAAIAAAGSDETRPDIAALRTRTQAALVVESEAQRNSAGWSMSATIHGGGEVRQVAAEGADAIATAAVLADRIRGALSPQEVADAHRSVDPAVRDLAARMQAALYAGQSKRALELADTAPALAANEEVAMLRAHALLALGRYDEMENALARLSLSPNVHWRAGALVLRAKAKYSQQRADLAVPDLKAAIALLDATNERLLLARAWAGLGVSQYQLGDTDAAETSLLRARMIIDPAQQPIEMARSDQNLGLIAIQRSRYDEAGAMFERAADTFVAFGMREAEAAARMNIATTQFTQLDYSAVLATLSRVKPLTAQIDAGSLRYRPAHMEAETLLQSGQLAAAQAAYAALERAAADTDAAVASDAHLAQSRIALQREDLRGARALLDSLKPVDDASLRLSVPAQRLRLAMAGDDRAAAARAAAEISTDALEKGEPLDRIAAQTTLAEWLDRNADAGAAAMFEGALAVARADGTPMSLRNAAAPYVRFQLARGELEAARSLAALIAPYAERDFDCAHTAFLVARAGDDELAATRFAAAAQRLKGERRFDPSSLASNPPQSSDTLHP